jgi:PiT family inorganic phosphate transporter
LDSYSLLIIIVATSLLFEFANGWNDAANSIATIVSTRVLSPLVAVGWAAFWNFVAAFAFGTAVAKTMGRGLVRLDAINEYSLICALVGAILWTAVCTYLGLPISVSHALMGGMGGAAIVKAGLPALIIGGWILPVAFIVLSPLIGLVVGLILKTIVSHLIWNKSPRRVDRWSRGLQLISAAAYSLGHGTNDAQKGMGVITAGLVTAGVMKEYEVPLWVILSCHAAIAGGTMAGGWRVIKTMGQRITKLRPIDGFCAETAGALTLLKTASLGIPVSTTHTITGAIMGVGSVRRLSAVRWGVAGRIVWAWVLTIPVSGAIAACCFWALRHYFPGLHV